MYQQVLFLQTARVLQLLVTEPMVGEFYLSGGTALALQLGHRGSEDLDFFCERSFDPLLLQQRLERLGTLTDTEVGQDTINTYLDGVKLQFLGYPYPLLEPMVVWEGIKLSSLLDIACTKLITVSMRGSKKDFVDVYVLLQRLSLANMCAAVGRKYTGVDYSVPHLLKSLVYFDDAEGQPMPRMFLDISWDMVKQGIVSAVRQYKF